MKKITAYALILITFITISCKKEASLQSYLVDSQNKKEFISVDIPASIIQLKSDNISEEDKKTLQSIRKVNLIGLPYENATEETYQEEKNKLKEILKNSEYKELIKFKNDDANAIIYYSGKSDAINEIIAFGYSNKAGVGIARVLGDNMNPSKILEMMKDTKIDASDLDLNQFKAFLNK